MLGRVAIVVTMLVGCGSSTPNAVEPKTPRVSHASLPAAIRGFVPTNGIYLAGGGTVSTVFRVIVDFDAHTIYSATAPAGTPLHSKLGDEHTRPLTPPNEDHLKALASDVWIEEPPATSDAPVKGYEEYLTVPDLKDAANVVLIHEQGPITRPLAKKLIDEVRAAAAL
jgi:hypothetical protein